MSFNRSKLEANFSQEYERLNEQQRRAVDAIEGPVMVIAGPGTGKTQILASRIGKILLETDAMPDNILCLTYTDAGVVAMRKRLLQFIGPDAYKVNIYTFHAFCHDIIQENLSLFEKTSLDPISELEQVQLFKELIDALPKNNPLKRYRGDVYFEVSNLRRLFSNMKKEGWSPAFIRERIDAYLADLPNRDEFIYKRKFKEFKAGDLKQDKIQEEHERMDKLRAAVDQFDQFQAMMRQRNRYDFDDMINWVIRVFEEQPAVLSKYQEKYQYILVDEYQDTSGTQNRLVELLISYWDQPNVFVVGDDDQSIYRFQGANVENMLRFAERYQKDLLTVVLTRNYRSTQPILDISKTLIDRNRERLVAQLDGLSKDLQSSNDRIKHLVHQPVIREYDTQHQEMIGLVLSVRQLLAQGVNPGGIGIIYKENKYGDELARYFKKLDIPVYSKRQMNILEQPLAKNFISILSYISSELYIPYSGDELLFEILHYNWFHIPPIEVARVTMEVSEKKYADRNMSLRRHLVEAAQAPPRDLFHSGLHGGLARASAVMEKLISLAPNITLQQLCEAIIREAGVLSSIMQDPDKHWHLQVLTGLFEFIKEETRRDPSMSLQKLVGLIQLMDKEGISLPLMQVSGSDQGVNLMTAHSSKGLEFEYVFFVGCNAVFWEKKRKPGDGYKLPDTLFASQPVQSDEEELRRLFYVALTRAEQHLYISYSRIRENGKEFEPSMFIAEILETHKLPVEKAILDQEWLTEFSLLGLTAPEAPEIERMEEEYIGRILDKFVMNVSALNNYLHCPLEFYFKNLIRIPSPKNEAAEFGSAVHYALEQLFRKMKQDPAEAFPARDVFVADFDWYMNRHRESFTREEFARRMEYGHEILGAYYDEYIKRFNKVALTELNIRNVVVDGVPLKGKLDKLEFDGKMVNVVDYKTGDPEKARQKTKGPSDKQPLGGDYWRQAVFYKILVDNYAQKDWTVVSTEFNFVEPDKKKKYQSEKLVIGAGDIETVRQQVVDTWQKIRNREFYIGCGKDDCHWCGFVKTNQIAVALHSITDEDEEALEG